MPADNYFGFELIFGLAAATVNRDACGELLTEDCAVLAAPPAFTLAL
jgi:hypothetical protein